MGQASEVGDPFSDAALVYEEYTKEIISFDKSHASDWNWTVTVKNDNYAKYDAEAVTKFQKSVDELEAINTKYIEKFSKCTTKDYSFEYTHYLKLSRVSTISAEPAYKEFKISYGK